MSAKQACHAVGVCPFGRHRSWLMLVGFVLRFVVVVVSWNPSRRLVRTPVERFGMDNLSCFHMARISDNPASTVPSPVVKLDAIAYAGLGQDEFQLVRSMVESACLEVVGATITCHANDLLHQEEPCKSPAIIGALGRVILLHTNLDQDTIDNLQLTISETIDRLLYSVPPKLKQPVLVKIQNTNHFENSSNRERKLDVLHGLIENEVDAYELNKPIDADRANARSIERSEVCPSIHVELDAAEVTDPISSSTWMDTSTILVFDDLVDEDLRKRLLDVVLGSNAENWNDVQNGPDPNRWIRGGLLDVTTDAEDPGVDDEQQTSCWGLRDEVVEELCYDHGDAIEEFETILSQKVFPQFVLSRLPEAVFGACVSPLTANAPTHGDSFNFHIDGDPYLMPPSPWTDVYGRYPNRLKSKPRFMSCLVYLNNEWNSDTWGAPTRFLDHPTNSFYDVQCRPGRCVIMDQDVSHTVVPPTLAAGNRPRYSLVWKLILHPRTDGQDMTNLEVGRKWPGALFYDSNA